MTKAMTNQRQVFKPCLTQTEQLFWRRHTKVGPLDFISLGACLIFFFWFISMTSNFLSGCPPERNLGRFYMEDFRGYPSNQFSGYKLNGWLWQKINWEKCLIEGPSSDQVGKFLLRLITSFQICLCAIKVLLHIATMQLGTLMLQNGLLK